MTTPAVADHIAAVQQVLLDADIPCGWGRPPAGYGPVESWQGVPGQSEFAAYAFVSKIGSIDTSDDNLAGVVNEARPLVNIQCVGATDEQVERLIDQVKAALDAQTLTVAGRVLLRARFDVSETTFVDRDQTPHVHVGAVRYRIWTYPS